MVKSNFIVVLVALVLMSAIRPAQSQELPDLRDPYLEGLRASTALRANLQDTRREYPLFWTFIESMYGQYNRGEVEDPGAVIEYLLELGADPLFSDDHDAFDVARMEAFLPVSLALLEWADDRGVERESVARLREQVTRQLRETASAREARESSRRAEVEAALETAIEPQPQTLRPNVPQALPHSVSRPGFSSDGRIVVFAPDYDDVAVANVTSAELLQLWSFPFNAMPIAISADGSHAYANHGGSIYTLNVETGEQSVFVNVDFQVKSIVPTDREGELLLAANNYVRLVRREGDHLEIVFFKTLEGLGDDFSGIEWSRDRTRWLIQHPNRWMLYDEFGNRIRAYNSAVALHPDGTIIAHLEDTGNGSKLSLRDVDSDNLVAEVALGPFDKEAKLLFSPDGRLVVAGPLLNKNGELLVLDARTLRVVEGGLPAGLDGRMYFVPGTNWLAIVKGPNHSGVSPIIDLGPLIADMEQAEAIVHALLSNPSALFGMAGEVGALAIRWAVEAGADIHAKDKYGQTLLVYAIDAQNIEAAASLLDLGADVDAKTAAEWTPLMYASRAGLIEAVDLLLEYGADILAVNSEGQTAVDLASPSIAGLMLHHYQRAEEDLVAEERVERVAQPRSAREQDFASMLGEDAADLEIMTDVNLGLVQGPITELRSNPSLFIAAWFSGQPAHRIYLVDIGERTVCRWEVMPSAWALSRAQMGLEYIDMAKGVAAEVIVPDYPQRLTVILTMYDDGTCGGLRLAN